MIGKMLSHNSTVLKSSAGLPRRGIGSGCSLAMLVLRLELTAILVCGISLSTRRATRHGT